MSTTLLTIRLDEDKKKQLEQEAKLEERSSSYLVSQAISSMLEAKRRKREIIRQALDEAEKGEFISQDTVDKWIDTWGTKNEASTPQADIFFKK